MQKKFCLFLLSIFLFLTLLETVKSQNSYHALSVGTSFEPMAINIHGVMAGSIINQNLDDQGQNAKNPATWKYDTGTDILSHVYGSFTTFNDENVGGGYYSDTNFNPEIGPAFITKDQTVSYFPNHGGFVVEITENFAYGSDPFLFHPSYQIDIKTGETRQIENNLFSLPIKNQFVNEGEILIGLHMNVIHNYVPEGGLPPHTLVADIPVIEMNVTDSSGNAISTFPMDGIDSAIPSSINNNGTIVGYKGYGGDIEAAIWVLDFSDEGEVTVSEPYVIVPQTEDYSSIAYDINNNGHIVGAVKSKDYYSDQGEVFVFDPQNGVRDLNSLLNNESKNSGVVINKSYSINDHGFISATGLINTNDGNPASSSFMLVPIYDVGYKIANAQYDEITTDISSLKRWNVDELSFGEIDDIGTDVISDYKVGNPLVFMTHGWLPNTPKDLSIGEEKTGWMIEMASAITTGSNGNKRNDLEIYGYDWVASASSPGKGASDALVSVVNAVSESQNAFRAINELFLNRDFVKSVTPITLIGYSHGGVLMANLAYQMVQSGYLIERLVLLDVPESSYSLSGMIVGATISDGRIQGLINYLDPLISIENYVSFFGIPYVMTNGINVVLNSDHILDFGLKHYYSVESFIGKIKSGNDVLSFGNEEGVQGGDQTENQTENQIGYLQSHFASYYQSESSGSEIVKDASQYVTEERPFLKLEIANENRFILNLLEGDESMAIVFLVNGVTYPSLIGFWIDDQFVHHEMFPNTQFMDIGVVAFNILNVEQGIHLLTIDLLGGEDLFYPVSIDTIAVSRYMIPEPTSSQLLFVVLLSGYGWFWIIKRRSNR